MILVADSGSTKSSWCLMAPDGSVIRYESSGINPYYQSEQEIEAQLRLELMPQLAGKCPARIYFYGAGCGVPDKQAILSNCFERLWPVVKSEVESDLLGAARSLLQHQSGIACILGTGSNSGLYDGSQIIANVSAGGYILGDEGSGAVLGKLLASDYLKNQLPLTLKQAFEQRYSLTPAQLIDKVYRQPFANRYLAQFTHFINEFQDEPCMYNMVYTSFNAFVTRNIYQYENYNTLPIGFVGSVAHVFRPILERVFKEHNLQLGSIVRGPLDGIVRYHSEATKH